MATSKLSRRDLLMAGGGLVVGLALGYGFSQLTRPAAEVVTPSGTETLTPSQTKSAGGPKKSVVKIAVVTFTTGAASVFGVPAANMARLMADFINQHGGINGARVELDIRDESGGADQMVALYRQLVSVGGVDVYIGLISSSDCLAVAPVAEELGTTLTVFFDCATKRLVDERTMKKVVFRTGGTTVQDGVALAKAVLQHKPDVKTVVGLNQDYAYGRDEWEDFITALKKLKPDVEVLDTLWTPLFTTDYSAQISKIIDLKPDLVHTSYWGPDLANFIQQAAARGLFRVTTVAFARGESMLQEVGAAMPEGQIVEGPHYFEYPAASPLNKQIVEEYRRRYGAYPPYPAYHMANAILGVKYAIEAASMATGEDWPDLSSVSKVFERLAYLSPGDWIIMTPNHNAARGAVVGITKSAPQYNFKVLRPYQYVPPAEINPPPDMTSKEWYAAW